MKIYQNIDVYTAAYRRIYKIMCDFEYIYFSISFGKDSSVMLQIALQVAQDLGKLPIHVMLIDLEGQYKLTMDHAEEFMNDPRIIPYWICLPLNLRNAVSQFQPQWICWDDNEKNKWIRPMPKCSINTKNMPVEWSSWFKYGMEFEEFVVYFGKWFGGDNSTACMVGIRADESMNRYRTLINEKKERYDNLPWSTRIKACKQKKLYNFYPIYDFKTADIWTCVGKNNFKYNHIYDYFYKTGRSIDDMRICQPYGDDQRKGLDLFAECEPETWAKVVERVNGANMGAIYKGEKLLGNYKVELPKGLTYEKYSVILLRSMPKYLSKHYLVKIRIFIKWYKDKGYPNGIPDTADVKSEASKEVPSWRRICKCILKNDFLCKSLSFSQNKNEYNKLTNSINKYENGNN